MVRKPAIVVTRRDDWRDGCILLMLPWLAIVKSRVVPCPQDEGV